MGMEFIVAAKKKVDLKDAIKNLLPEVKSSQKDKLNPEPKETKPAEDIKLTKGESADSKAKAVKVEKQMPVKPKEGVKKV